MGGYILAQSDTTNFGGDILEPESYYWTTGQSSIGILRLNQSSTGVNWISCSTGTPINFDYEEVEGGLIIKDTSTGQTLNRSGDWLSLGHDASDGDKL